MTGPLEGLSSKAPQHLLAELAALLEERGGPSIRFTSAGGVDVARRVREGEHADVVVLAAGAMTTLERDGLLVTGTLRPLFVSQVVLAVPTTAPVPPLRTEADLVAVLRSAGRIAHSTGPSGAALLRRIEEWGLAEELDGRLVQAPPGTPVATLLAHGRADVGVQQRSELAGAAGVHVVGPLPGAAAVTSTFSGAVLTASRRPAAADEVLAFLGSDTARPTVEAHGMRPAKD